METVQRIIDKLHLKPHPEGGFYRETFRSPLVLNGLSGNISRSASTAIYYLLPAGTISALHRVRNADEVWHYYAGDPVMLHFLIDGGEHTVIMLGSDMAAGQVPQAVVPAGVWQAALPQGNNFSLCGCTVAPGFDFADFEMPSRAELIRKFPAHKTLIKKLTKRS